MKLLFGILDAFKFPHQAGIIKWKVESKCYTLLDPELTIYSDLKGLRGRLGDVS
jgi:hypothetical protein